jgi:uncharacterized short protein YbdD (DUF466 family)
MLGRRKGRNERNVRKHYGARFRLLRLFRSFHSFIRSIAGMPDYEAYLEHFRRFHPDAPLLTRRQFYMEFVQARYGDGPTRCC